MWDRARLAGSLLGLGITAYLTVQHYGGAVPLACPSGGAINCERVLTSPQAVVFGVPVAVWGLCWFAIAAALAAASLSQSGPGEPPWLRRGALAWAAAGAAAVVWLVYMELAVLGAVCVWCSAVHVLVIGLFCLQVLTDPLRAPEGT